MDQAAGIETYLVTYLPIMKGVVFTDTDANKQHIFIYNVKRALLQIFKCAQGDVSYHCDCFK